eukprot:9548652-Alexandrium_andersonii.AAC.1
MQSAIRARPANATIRFDPQSAMRRMQNRFKRANLELRGPKSGLEIGPRSSRRGRSAPCFAQIQNPPTRTA